ncbi:MAG: hypothetical protein ACYS8Y_09405 [Planctomycetota bacterium]
MPFRQISRWLRAAIAGFASAGRGGKSLCPSASVERTKPSASVERTKWAGG